MQHSPEWCANDDHNINTPSSTCAHSHQRTRQRPTHPSRSSCPTGSCGVLSLANYTPRTKKRNSRKRRSGIPTLNFTLRRLLKETSIRLNLGISVFKKVRYTKLYATDKEPKTPQYYECHPCIERTDLVIDDSTYSTFFSFLFPLH